MKNYNYLNLFAAVILLGFSASSFSETTGASKSNTAVKYFPSGWVVSCKASSAKSPLVCDVSQKIMSSKGQVLVAIAFKVADKTSYTMDMQLPHGLDLQSGLQLQIDKGKLKQIAFSTSLASGTYATAKLKKSFVDRFRKESFLHISFNGTNKSKITVPVGLTGFARALAKIK